MECQIYKYLEGSICPICLFVLFLFIKVRKPLQDVGHNESRAVQYCMLSDNHPEAAQVIPLSPYRIPMNETRKLMKTLYNRHWTRLRSMRSQFLILARMIFWLRMLAHRYVIPIWYVFMVSHATHPLTIFSRCFSGDIRRRSPQWRKLPSDMRIPAPSPLSEEMLQDSRSEIRWGVSGAATPVVCLHLTVFGIQTLHDRHRMKLTFT